MSGAASTPPDRAAMIERLIEGLHTADVAFVSWAHYQPDGYRIDYGDSHDFRTGRPATATELFKSWITAASQLQESDDHSLDPVWRVVCMKALNDVRKLMAGKMPDWLQAVYGQLEALEAEEQIRGDKASAAIREMHSTENAKSEA